MDRPAEHYVRTVELDRASVPSFDQYPFCIPGIRNLHKLDLHPKVTFFVGDNGTGKSTLLEAIAVAVGFNPEGGGKNWGFATRESHSELHQYLRLRRGTNRFRDGYFFRAESFFNVATAIEQRDADPESGGGEPIISAYGGKSLHEQSHGESFLSLLTNRFVGNGLYLLDEPEAALSPLRQMSVLTAMHDLIKQNSQFIIATHSPILMSYPDATIYLFTADATTRVEYTQTEHYTVTRDFLSRYQSMLEVLLSD